MKTFTFRYIPDELSLSKRVKKAVGGTPYVKPDELVSKSLKTLLQLITESRLEIFGAIFREKPNSIYALAEKMGKSQPFILKEVHTLESLGLIRLVRELDGNRERLRPVALYSKVVIDCGFEKSQKEAS